jgi:hypothetical protein
MLLQVPAAFAGNGINLFPFLLARGNITHFLQHLEGRINTPGTGHVKVMETFLNRPYYFIAIAGLFLHVPQDNVLEISPVKRSAAPRTGEKWMPVCLAPDGGHLEFWRIQQLNDISFHRFIVKQQRMTVNRFTGNLFRVLASGPVCLPEPVFVDKKEKEMIIYQPTNL